MKKVNKEPVYLRQRKRANGLISLYLDICRDGHRVNEYLKLYLVPGTTKEVKEKNRQTLQLAQSIKAQRTIEIQNGEYGFRTVTDEQVLFFEYYRSLVERRFRSESKSNGNSWICALKHIEGYEKNRNITMAQITPAWVQGFRDYLEKKAKAYSRDKRDWAEDRLLSPNSRVTYFNKLRACLRQAYEDGIILKNPMRGVDGFHEVEGTRMYLTIDELRQMQSAECQHPGVKRAFMFSCLTGLRRSDIIKLTWGEIHRQGGFTRIIFRQKKTGGQEYIDITPQAAGLIGERGSHASNDLVFGDMLSTPMSNHYIKEWALRAGVDKIITFHCARHTFATMMLDIGTDIYTVSKLLGHRELSTTQIYAKVIDKNKQAAVARIPNILDI